MHFFDRLWTGVTYFLSVVTLSPVHDGVNNQMPLSVSFPSRVSAVAPVEPTNYPKFVPPGGSPEDPFVCEYPQMPDWEPCSTPADRTCWLRHKRTGERYDIHTDYENDAPIGIQRNYTLNITDSWFAADGLNFTDAKLFNNTYPGPWVQSCWGDRIVVNVTNNLTHNGTSVHWHGIRQLDSVHMDGVNGVTQCPIAPKDYFVYNFTTRQYGSSWYHSHYSVQYADGAAGGMTIHGPTSAPWDEAVSPPLIMTDWYHNSSFFILSNTSDNAAKDILLNGNGDIRRFNNTIQNTTEVQPPLNVIFEPPRPGKRSKKYLLRIINTSFDTTFVFSIDNHLLQVISADFVPIHPYSNTSILVGIGQRYNVIVEANPMDRTTHPDAGNLDVFGNYWIRTQIATCFKGSNQGSCGYEQTGILRYNVSSNVDPRTTKWSKISTRCSDETYTSLKPVLPWNVTAPVNGLGKGPQYGQAFEVYFSREVEPQDYPVATFAMDNPDVQVPMRVDYTDPMILHLDPVDHTPENKTLWRVVPENYTNNEWIYFVMHGSKAGLTARAHPIHLHGHDFAILEEASKPWDPDKMNLTLFNPPRRDVVLLPADGYVVLAFKADNPGPWLVHCHIAEHISMGLGMQILEDQPGAFRLWPNDSHAIVEARRVCKKWNRWVDDPKHWANPPPPLGQCTYANSDWCFQDDSGV